MLYVACTRARNGLHLIGNVSVNGDALKPPTAGSLLHRLWPALEPHFEAAFAESSIAEEAGDYDDAHLKDPILRRLTVAPPSDPPPLPRLLDPVTTSDEEVPVEYYWVGSAARHAGTIVHRWLQRVADGMADIEDREKMHLVSRRWAHSLGVRDDEVDAVCERVSQAIERIATDEKGRNILFGEGKSELGLTGVIDGNVQSVVLDRIHVDGDGVHWIIDYKTSSHEGGDLAGFIEQEKDRYRPQLEKYAAIYRNLTDAPVKTALYFPLLQEFVEVD